MVKGVTLVSYILVVNFIFLVSFILGNMIMNINDLRTLTLQEYDHKYRQKTLFDDNIPIIIGIVIHIVISLYMITSGESLMTDLRFLNKLITHKNMESVDSDVIYWFVINSTIHSQFNEFIDKLGLSDMKEMYRFGDAKVDQVNIIFSFTYKLIENEKLHTFSSMARIKNKKITIYTDSTDRYAGVESKTLDFLSKAGKIFIRCSGPGDDIKHLIFDGSESVTNPQYIQLKKYIKKKLNEFNVLKNYSEKISTLQELKDKINRELNEYTTEEQKELRDIMNKIEILQKETITKRNMQNTKTVSLNVTGHPQSVNVTGHPQSVNVTGHPVVNSPQPITYDPNKHKKKKKFKKKQFH